MQFLDATLAPHKDYIWEINMKSHPQDPDCLVSSSASAGLSQSGEIGSGTWRIIWLMRIRKRPQHYIFLIFQFALALIHRFIGKNEELADLNVLLCNRSSTIQLLHWPNRMFLFFNFFFLVNLVSAAQKYSMEYRIYDCDVSWYVCISTAGTIKDSIRDSVCPRLKSHLVAFYRLMQSCFSYSIKLHRIYHTKLCHTWAPPLNINSSKVSDSITERNL